MLHVLPPLERTVLRQIDDAVESPDSPQGFPINIGNQVSTAPDARSDGNVEIMVFFQLAGNAPGDISIQFIEVV